VRIATVLHLDDDDLPAAARAQHRPSGVGEDRNRVQDDNAPSWLEGSTDPPGSVRIATAWDELREPHTMRQHRPSGVGEDRNRRSCISLTKPAAQHRPSGVGEDRNMMGVAVTIPTDSAAPTLRGR